MVSRIDSSQNCSIVAAVSFASRGQVLRLYQFFARLLFLVDWFRRSFKKYLEEADAVIADFKDFDLQIHCNGDAAIGLALSSLSKQRDRAKRTTLIHCQTVTSSQLKLMREIDVHPSFFVNHCYYWGKEKKNLFPFSQIL